MNEIIIKQKMILEMNASNPLLFIKEKNTFLGFSLYLLCLLWPDFLVSADAAF